MVKTKSVYDPKSTNDGVRVLVTRYWPRGVKKDRADHWLRGLGPEPGLIKVWKAGRLSWERFTQSYLSEYRDEAKKALLNDLKGIIKGAQGRDVTLLCTCRDEQCHRTILKEMLKGKGGLKRGG